MVIRLILLIFNLTTHFIQKIVKKVNRIIIWNGRSGRDMLLGGVKMPEDADPLWLMVFTIFLS